MSNVLTLKASCYMRDDITLCLKANKKHFISSDGSAFLEVHYLRVLTSLIKPFLSKASFDSNGTRYSSFSSSPFSHL